MAKKPKLIVLRGLTGSGKSTVARILSEKHPEITVIDIDKVMGEGNTSVSYCLSEAGKRAKTGLDGGRPVIVQYAFDKFEQIVQLLGTTGLTLSDDTLCFVRLECTKEEAYERKKDGLSREKQLDEEYLKVIPPLPREVVICTSKRSAPDVADEVSSKVQLTQSPDTPVQAGE